ncbi:MAG TPA: response regulator transcription factor [Symbiobacteriaceae bacterium]|nr:response regulator transcription factor [Symbiobacteriaceae bacterium]
MIVRQIVLIIDDEPRIQRFIRANLTAAGFEVALAGTAADAVNVCEQRDPDLILLDLGLPDMDGLELFQRLRGMTESPVVILTARGSAAEKVKGLDMGADDYIAKPFDVNELLARVRAVMRRSQKGAGGPAKARVDVGPLALDVARYEARLNGELVHLTPTEFKLLAYLATNADRVVLHEELLSHVWGPEYRGAVEYLRVTVLRIRQKLGDHPDVKQLIRNVVGIGYKLVRP